VLDLPPHRPIRVIRRVDRNAHERVRLQRLKEVGIPRETHRAAPCASRAPDERLRLVGLARAEIRHARQARRVFQPGVRKRSRSFIAEQPRRRDEAVRLQPDPPKLRARPVHEVRRRRPIQVVKLALIRRVDACRKNGADPFRRFPGAEVMVAVNDNLMPDPRLLLQPIAEGPVIEKMSLPVMIRHHQQ